jgi:hypothetical protein
VDCFLLRAVIRYHGGPPQIDPNKGLGNEAVVARESAQKRASLVMAHYLAGSISLSRAAELPELPWLDLRSRFLRLDIPVRAAQPVANTRGDAIIVTTIIV